MVTFGHSRVHWPAAYDTFLLQFGLFFFLVYVVLTRSIYRCDDLRERCMRARPLLGFS
jgi:hypothetical protein